MALPQNEYELERAKIMQENRRKMGECFSQLINAY